MSEKLLKIFKSILSFPRRMLFFPYRQKKRDDGIIYASQFMRSTSILIDLIILFLLLQTVNFSTLKFIDFKTPIEIVEKAKLKANITNEEKLMLSYYQKKVITILAVTQLIQFAILFFLVIFMWNKFGGTPGKLILGLKILDKTTLKNPSILKCIKRFFMFPVSVLCLFLGVLWSAFDKDAQTWHDKVANTIVVRKHTLPQ